MAHPQPAGAQAFPQEQDNSPNRAGTAAVTSSDADHELTKSFVNALKVKGIKLLALDFDNTFIDTHTRGSWDKPVDELARKVRPCMRDLLLLAARDKDLKVCIVTFFKDEKIIRELLQHVYNSDPDMESCLIQHLSLSNPPQDHKSEEETEVIVRQLYETFPEKSEEIQCIAYFAWYTKKGVTFRLWGEIHCFVMNHSELDLKFFKFVENMLHHLSEIKERRRKKKSPKKGCGSLFQTIVCCATGRDSTSSTASETEMGAAAQAGPSTSTLVLDLPVREEMKARSLQTYSPAGGEPAEPLGMEISMDDSGGQAGYSHDKLGSPLSADGSEGKSEYPQGQPGSLQGLNESGSLSWESQQKTSPSLSSSDESGANDYAYQAESSPGLPGPSRNLQASGDVMKLRQDQPVPFESAAEAGATAQLPSALGWQHLAGAEEASGGTGAPSSQSSTSQKGKGKAKSLASSIKSAAIRVVKGPKKYLAKKLSRTSSAAGTGEEVEEAEGELGSQLRSMSQHVTKPPEETSLSEGASTSTGYGPGSSGGPSSSGDQPGPSSSSQGESGLGTQPEAGSSSGGSPSTESETTLDFASGTVVMAQAAVAAQMKRQKKGVKRWRQEQEDDDEDSSPPQRPRTDSDSPGHGSSGMEQDEPNAEKSDSSIEDKLTAGLRELDSPVWKKRDTAENRDSSSSSSD